MVTTFVVGIVFTGACFHYPYTLGIERAFLKVKTKEDCIKAGRHPQIEPFGVLADETEESDLAYLSDLYNRLHSNDGDCFMGHAINRQNSTTSM